jgi:peptidoglycan/LPS O-acetylase OafA/YrhL
MRATDGTNSASKRERLYGLDALRGMAALTIVLYHWPFFFDGANFSASMRDSLLPFQGLLRVVYLYGYLAVDLFFGISGFVFFWLYADDVAFKRTSAPEFAIRRLSRLYPLHLVTLAVVALGQLGMLRVTGEYFCIEWNDMRHLLLNLFMASSWGFERDMSFNGPAWSVSVEVALYAAFFLFCRWMPRRSWLMLAVAFASRIVFHGYFPLGRGLWSFFIGGVIAQWYADAKRRPATEGRDGLIIGGTLALWVATLLCVSPGFLSPATIMTITRASDAQRATDVMYSLGNNWVRAVLFPATIVSVLLLDGKLGVRLRSLELLGEISYGTYLWHFPLMLLVVLASVRFGIDRATFGSSLYMLLFLSALVAWSLVSFRKFERPVQTWIRKRLLAGT